MLDSAIQKDIVHAVEALQKSGHWPAAQLPEIRIDIPAEESHGDFSSPAAMQLASVLRKSPLEIANDIKSQLQGEYDHVQIVHPGFLNFFVSSTQRGTELKEIIKKGEAYGKANIGHRQKVLLEFISANPTGPLTLPNGRGGYLGDVLSNVLSELGYAVIREYYINDRGNQIDLLGESVVRRYLQSMRINVPYSEECYQGEYINDIAQQIEWKDYKLTNLKKIEWIRDRVKTQALALMLAEIKRVVKEKMQITYDNWMSEKSLYDAGLPEKVLKTLQEKDAVYEKDGAQWVRTSNYGDDKDRVLVKTSGEGAYMQGDFALVYERAFERKVRKVILILGADHHGYEKRLKAIPQLLGADMQFDIIFTQMATLMKDGEEIRMSKRKGNFVTIEELIDEVGNDVARFFFLMYSSDRHMNFDLGLAKEKSDNNPVYYVQYAHARLCSILREVEKLGTPVLKDVTVEHAAEKALLKQLHAFPTLLQSVGQTYEVNHLATYAVDLARAFHHFYGNCRVIDNDVVNPSRYALILATKQVLQKTLTLLGVSAPEKM